MADSLQSLKELQATTGVEAETPSKDVGTIGARIRWGRKKISLSQGDLAEKLSVTQPTVANWESGVHDPRQLMLAKLADVLGVNLGWLASGERSNVEKDTHAAAAYLRRQLYHVPIISLDNAEKLIQTPQADLHSMAMDYIPITAGSGRHFGLFIRDQAMNLAFPGDTLVVINIDHRAAVDGDTVLVTQPERQPILRRWKVAPNRLEPYSSNPNFETIYVDGLDGVIGIVEISIHFH